MEFLQTIFGFSNWIQILSLVSGVVYMTLQVIQNKWMWYFGMLTAGSALIVSLVNFSDGAWAPLWAQVGLNSYFFTMDIVGIFSWRRISKENPNHNITMKKLKRKSVLKYGIGIMLGAPLFCVLFSLTNDPNPVAEGISFALSITAQIMLARMHVEQWFMWMAADIIAIIIFAGEGAWGMVALYYAYMVSGFFGIYWWRQHGTLIE